MDQSSHCHYYRPGRAWRTGFFVNMRLGIYFKEQDFEGACGQMGQGVVERGSRCMAQREDAGGAAWEVLQVRAGVGCMGVLGLAESPGSAGRTRDKRQVEAVPEEREKCEKGG